MKSIAEFQTIPIYMIAHYNFNMKQKFQHTVKLQPALMLCSHAVLRRSSLPGRKCLCSSPHFLTVSELCFVWFTSCFWAILQSQWKANPLRSSSADQNHQKTNLLNIIRYKFDYLPSRDHPSVHAAATLLAVSLVSGATSDPSELFQQCSLFQNILTRGVQWLFVFAGH